MSYVTVIKSVQPETLGKRFELDCEGKITKNAIANVWEGKATTLALTNTEDLQKVLTHVCEASDLALMPGRFSNATNCAKISLVTEAKLAELLDCENKLVPGGVQEVNGKKYAARLKRGIENSDWLLIDADNPPGIPQDWAYLDLEERLKMLEPIIPGLSKCLRVEYRASSARVVKQGKLPSGATHAWVQISDASKVELLREHVKLQMQLRGLSFKSPRFSSETGEVTGYGARTVIDLAVWVPGRLVFCSKPDLRADGYYLADADVKIVNPDGDKLDVSDINIPSKADLRELTEATGQKLSYSRLGIGLSITDTSSLTWQTPVEIKGRSHSLWDVVAGMQAGEKVRCEAPFRASSSEAAFIRVMENGMPMLHDVGTSTNYFVADPTEPVADNRSSAVSVESIKLTVPNTSRLSDIAGSHLNKLSTKELLQGSNQIARDAKGNPVFNHATVMEVIRASTDWDGVLAYNEMSEQLLLMLPVPGTKTPKTSFKPRSLGDDDYVHALSWFNRNGFPRAKKETIVDCMETVSKENVLSPVRHYLEDLEAKGAWDQTKRLHRLFQDYFGTVEDVAVPDAKSDYLAAIGVKFMIAAVARAMVPGCKVDTMLVLEGAQGAGKSSAARILAGASYFSDSLPPMNTKDASDHVRGKWIIEIGELSAMQKSEIESTKAFISRQEEKFRPPYRRNEIAYKRRCVFIGTTNQDAYLRDETGNRRFWPVAVGKIDQKALERDRDLLWAEALFRYRAGEKWYLTASEDQLATRVQRDRVSEDIWQSELAVALEDESEIAIRGAACRLGLSIENLNRTDQNRITSALKALGFVRRGKFTTGGYRNSARYVRQID
jgi:hypothetical protein